MLKFSSLKNNRTTLVKEIVNYLGLDYSKEMLKDYYPPNSSYIEKRKKNNPS